MVVKNNLIKTCCIAIFLGYVSFSTAFYMVLAIFFWFIILYFLFHFTAKEFTILKVNYNSKETIVIKCGILFLLFYVFKFIQFGNYDVFSLLLTAYCFSFIFYFFSRVYRGEFILQKTITESDTLSVINKFVTSLKNLFQ